MSTCFRRLTELLESGKAIRPFSLKLDGNALPEASECILEGNTLRTELGGGIVAETKFTCHSEYGSVEWVTWFENLGSEPSPLMSEICDADVFLPVEYDEPPITRSYVPSEAVLHVFNPTGSDCCRSEFVAERVHPADGYMPCPFLPGAKLNFAPSGGRSSDGKHAPFFDLCRQGEGYIIAVGWTGQWCAAMERNNEAVRFTCGVHAAAFRLLPGERIRTCSCVIMPYTGGQNTGHNKWRRLVKEHYSLVGAPGRPQYGPLCLSFWGGLCSDTIIERVNKVGEARLGAEYAWVDAGWYGYAEHECINEFEGDWYMHTGSWVVNKNYHPDGMLDMSAAMKGAGLGFLLWVEPERCLKNTDTVREHPDWFLYLEDNGSCLLNLGNEEACNGTIELIDGLISKLNLAVYRQDFNIQPLPFWREADTEDRKGITEIKHIMGLYRFWDTLLERHPGLLIDNCSSGGRRIDIETVRRSIPLWRSDYQCNMNHDSETDQLQGTSFSWWLPFTGTGLGNEIGNLYRTRSAYAPALNAGFYYCGLPGNDFDPETAPWVRDMFTEYKRVRPYLSGDYYRLLPDTFDESNWSASRYELPEEGKGLIMAFRRGKSPFETAYFDFENVKADAEYSFEAVYETENGTETERWSVSGQSLAERGLYITLPRKHSSVIMYYTFG